MMERTGRRTVPQIYIGETHVGGYDDLVALDRAGGLAPLLAGPDAGGCGPARFGIAPFRASGRRPRRLIAG